MRRTKPLLNYEGAFAMTRPGFSGGPRAFRDPPPRAFALGYCMTPRGSGARRNMGRLGTGCVWLIASLRASPLLSFERSPPVVSAVPHLSFRAQREILSRRRRFLSPSLSLCPSLASSTHKTPCLVAATAVLRRTCEFDDPSIIPTAISRMETRHANSMVAAAVTTIMKITKDPMITFSNFSTRACITASPSIHQTLLIHTV